MCVRKSSARRVLQFTPFNVASYVLHRPASRVIHRLQLYCILLLLFYSKSQNFFCGETGVETPLQVEGSPTEGSTFQV
jgi:hypothetical protein